MLTAARGFRLWFVCQVRTNGPLQPKNYADPGLPRPVPPSGARRTPGVLERDEGFTRSRRLVVAAHLTGKADTMTAFWSASCGSLGLAHAVVYWVGFPRLAPCCPLWHLSPRWACSGKWLRGRFRVTGKRAGGFGAHQRAMSANCQQENPVRPLVELAGWPSTKPPSRGHELNGGVA